MRLNTVAYDKFVGGCVIEYSAGVKSARFESQFLSSCVFSHTDEL